LRGCFECQKRLRLSREVDECKPLPAVGWVRLEPDCTHVAPWPRTKVFPE